MDCCGSTQPWSPAISLALAATLLAASSVAQTPLDPMPPPASPSAGPVCLLLPLSGPHKALGERMFRAFEAGWKEAGETVALRRFDTRGTVLDAVAVTMKAADEHCVLAVGGVGDREALACADAAENAAMALVSLGAAPDGKERAHVTWVREARVKAAVAVAGELAVQGAVAATVLYADNGWGRAMAEAFRAAFESAGGRVVVRRAVSGPDAAKAAQDVALEVVRAREGAVCVREALFLAADLATSRRLLPFLEFAGVTGVRPDPKCPPALVAGTPAWNDAAGVARGGDALNGAVFADEFAQGEPAVEGAVERAVAVARAQLAAAQGADPAGAGPPPVRGFRLFEIRRGAIVPRDGDVAAPVVAPGPAGRADGRVRTD